jgi:hypothetical protein
MRKDWNGLVKILEIEYIDTNGKILWSQRNLYNVFHTAGEQFVLSAVFSGGVNNTIIPYNYYFGLDNRTTISAGDTMGTITNEPSSNGYARIPLSSTGVFTVSLPTGGTHYRADGPIISFVALGGSWGPVSNLFLTTQSDNTGVLIASVPLTQTVTINTGEAVNMRMGLTLKDC